MRASLEPIYGLSFPHRGQVTLILVNIYATIVLTFIEAGLPALFTETRRPG